MRWLAGHELRSLPGLPEHRLPRHVPHASVGMPSSSPTNIIAGCHCAHRDSPRPPSRRSDSTRRAGSHLVVVSADGTGRQGDSCADFRLSLHRPRGSAAQMAGMFAVEQYSSEDGRDVRRPAISICPQLPACAMANTFALWLNARRLISALRSSSAHAQPAAAASFPTLRSDDHPFASRCAWLDTPPALILTGHPSNAAWGGSQHVIVACETRDVAVRPSEVHHTDPSSFKRQV